MRHSCEAEYLKLKEKHKELLKQYKKAVKTMKSCTFYEQDYNYGVTHYWKEYNNHLNFILHIEGVKESPCGSCHRCVEIEKDNWLCEEHKKPINGLCDMYLAMEV